MSRSVRFGVGLAAGLFTVAAARYGGWAVVSVEQAPEYLVVGRATHVTFAVRQHGVSLMTDLANPANGARMPKPDLRVADIGPIVAFLNAERRTAGK